MQNRGAPKKETRDTHRTRGMSQCWWFSVSYHRNSEAQENRFPKVPPR